MSECLNRLSEAAAEIVELGLSDICFCLFVEVDGIKITATHLYKSLRLLRIVSYEDIAVSENNPLVIAIGEMAKEICGD